MILTKEQIADKRTRLVAVNQTHACACMVKMAMQLDGLNLTTQCTEITYCDLHDPQDYLDTIEAAWQERDTSGSEGGQMIPLEKIADAPPQPCMHPEHNPPSQMVYQPGTYRYTCPACGYNVTFVIHATC